jgi:hypothetical protein
VAGTQPVSLCNGAATQVAGWDVIESPRPTMVAAAPRPIGDDSPGRSAPRLPAEEPAEQPKPKSKGFFGKILDIFK